MGTSLKVGVIDDHEIFRRGLVSALGEDSSLEVVFEGGPDDSPDPLDCDVVVVAWEAIDGLALTCPVVLLAPGEGRKAVPSGTRLEVSAILPRKDITGEQVIVAVRAAAAGLRVESEPDEGLPSDAPLDERRLQVLRLLAEGADTRTIARRLTYSERTVKTLIRDLELALGAQNRAQAVAEGLRRGII